MSAPSPREARYRRHRRIRARVSGTTTRPRISVFRSLRHLYAQMIDDTQGHTLVAVSTLEKGLREELDGVNKVEVARRLGAILAQRAQHRAITQAVFDRSGYRYHGRVKALAEGARQAGLNF